MGQVSNLAFLQQFRLLAITPDDMLETSNGTPSTLPLKELGLCYRRSSAADIVIRQKSRRTISAAGYGNSSRMPHFGPVKDSIRLIGNVALDVQRRRWPV